MTTTLEIDPVTEAALIAAQNDAFRRSILGTHPVADAPKGQFVMTPGVAALGPDTQHALTRRVASFDAFNADSDPHGWHEMGVIDFDGTTVWFKIDLYDVDYRYGSSEPSDPAQTRRVLTLLLPSEY
ncbi:DUF3768 domain-containing protein [Cognatishimia sp. D5M38]|jgi:hypothetical protein|uniref:DUF3768 domain-containing protein n=1 Tax=Cognatishimia coralii TaxID=3083254 RepID=A0ABU8QLA3_9RHOB|nr:DUF3768 domain-containing protein [Donghicola eburneus]MCI5041579.1 DUF3768 domain-containing protein [Donghicola eburneus]